jgi:hypothetical protein
VTQRPSGWPPPADAAFDGGRLELPPLAEAIARRHLARHPDDVERYGEAAREWAVHDMQHVLAWAFGEHSGFIDLGHQVAWLARVLDGRGYPLVNLADCLEDAAAVVRSDVPGAGEVAARLEAVSSSVRASIT